MFGKGLLTGMGVTIRHFFGKKETFCYPEEKMEMTDAFRGGHLTLDWRVCIGCKQCQIVCPNKALDLTVVADAKKRRHMERYIHKSGRCLYCDLCVEICPVHTLHWTKDYAISFYNKDHITYDALTDEDRAGLKELLAKVEVKAKAEAAEKAKAEAEKAAAGADAKAATPEKTAASSKASINKKDGAGKPASTATKAAPAAAPPTAKAAEKGGEA